jgi:flagellar basal body-associated protein FliL
MVKDFKKTLNDRRMPSTLIILNRIMVMIIASAIILSTVFFMEIENGTKENERIALTTLAIDRRNIAMT